MGSDHRPPVAEKRPYKTTEHGVSRSDNYAWMRAENWQAVMHDPAVLDKEIRAHLEAENQYQEALMADTSVMQKTLFSEMKGRIKEDDSSIPLKDGPWAYGVSYVEGGEHPRFVRERPEGSDAIILLDGDAEARDRSYFTIGGCNHSPDHKTIAWSFDDKGSEYFTISFRNSETGNDDKNTIPNTNGGGVWTKASDAFFYTKLDEKPSPFQVVPAHFGVEHTRPTDF